MAEYNNKQQATFISTDNNQLEVIMEENITFTVEKKFIEINLTRNIQNLYK